MKKASLFLTFALALSVANAQSPSKAKSDKPVAKTETKTKSVEVTKTEKGNTKEKVWVCDTKTSTSYHSDKECSGIKKCSGTVKSMTAKEAEKDGKKACKMCVK
jgi:hypothetical protein